MDPSYLLSYRCASCGEENEILIDLSAGTKQTLTEDCTVCCRPNRISFSHGYDGNIDIIVDFDG